MDALLEQVNSLTSDDRLLFFQRAAERLTVGELVKLVPQLEKAWDVEAVPQPIGLLPPTTIIEEEVEKTIFDVVVTEVGSKRIAVVKVARELGEMSLKDASDLLKQMPATILTKVDKERAEAAQKTLEEAGATVGLQ